VRSPRRVDRLAPSQPVLEQVTEAPARRDRLAGDRVHAPHAQAQRAAAVHHRRRPVGRPVAGSSSSGVAGSAAVGASLITPSVASFGTRGPAASGRRALYGQQASRSNPTSFRAGGRPITPAAQEENAAPTQPARRRRGWRAGTPLRKSMRPGLPLGTPSAPGTARPASLSHDDPRGDAAALSTTTFASPAFPRHPR
jgi:hypothetical protein